MEVKQDSDDDTSRTVYVDGVVVGWIESGRAMTDLNSNWTEWGFTPSTIDAPRGPVRRTYSAAREDARLYVKGLTA